MASDSVQSVNVVAYKRPPTLAARLADARRRLFVGRETEKALFTELLAADGNLRVLYLHGAGGLGKTTLLREYAHIAGEQGLPVVQVDARSITAMPDALLRAVAGARQAAGVNGGTPHLIFLDTFEVLSVLEGWLREHWLPSQPDTVRVVLAGRTPPSTAWRTDAAWGASLRHHPLSYLEDDQARAYLACREIPAGAAEAGAAFARGHPLALALYADAAAGGDVTVPASDALLPELTASLLGNIENEARRHALYACGMVRSLTEPLLAAILEQEDGAALFDWLRRLSFIEAGPNGLFPHDLMRETLLADLKQRDPALYQQFGERAYKWLVEQIEQGRGDVMTHGLDAFFLLRDMQLPWHMAGTQAEEQFYIDRITDADWPQIETMVRRHENEQALATLQAFARAQPEALQVVRDSEQAVAGFFLLLALHKLPPALIESDAISAAFRARCQAGADEPVRASLLRFWMHRDKYMELSPIQPLVHAHFVLDAVASGLHYSGAQQMDTQVWRYIADLVGLQRLEASERELPGGPTVVMYQDYTEHSALDWLHSIYRRVQGLMENMPQQPALPGRPALTRVAFEQGLRAALKQYHRPDRLAGNPLLDCSLVAARSSGEDMEARLQTLRALIRQGCDELAANPKTEPLARALRHGYLVPAANQELAAEAACMAYSTFRRYLAEAVKLLAARLWMAERQSS